MIRLLDKMTKVQRAVAGLFLAIVLVLAVNIFSNVVFKPFQLDLTEGKLFTVSQATENVIATVDEPVTLRLYFTKALGEGNPDHARHFIRVRELLERYVDRADGKLRLELFDAEPFSESEDRAMAFGLSGVPFNEAGDLGYFGLVGTNSTDDVELIRYFSPDREQFLEYDLTKVVYRLTNPRKKIVGLISSLAIGGAGAVPFSDAPQWPVIDRIREFFEIRPLPSYIEKIPDDIDVLMIIHPRRFDQAALYAVDQFVLRGGRALVFVDSVVESSGRLGTGVAGAVRSNFDKILNSWGLSLVPDRVAGDIDAARRVRVRHEGRIAVVDYVAWLTLGRQNFDPSDVVVGGVDTLSVGTPGVLQSFGSKGMNVRPLIATGPRAMMLNARQFLQQPDVVGLFRDFKPENRRLTLAARVMGKAKSAFPSGPPKEAPESAGADGHIAEAKEPINAIVVGDVDMLHDQFWADIDTQDGRQILTPNANNVDFVINALDNLTGSGALIELRGRAQTTRPFDLIQDIRQRSEQQFRQKEQALQQRLAQSRAEMEALIQKEAAGGGAAFSAQQAAQIDAFRKEMLSVRRELRDVQHALRVDLERLDSWLKFLNIALIPILLIVGVALAAILRRRRAAKSATHA